MIKERPPLTPEIILDFIGQKTGLISRREIATHFQVKGGERIFLKNLLKGLVVNGTLLKKGKAYQSMTQDTFINAEVLAPNEEGEALLKPLKWPYGDKAPVMILSALKRAPAVGEKILVKFKDLTQRPIVADFVKILDSQRETLMGIFQKTGKTGTVLSTDRKDNRKISIDSEATLNANEGDLVELEILRSDKKNKADARVIKNYGPFAQQISPSLIAIKTHGLLDTFSEKALAEATKAAIPTLGTRVDLRHLPLVTIDDEDARDFDDAIYAERDSDEKNPHGWILWVAIADVSFYVQPTTRLDHEAFDRGNSVYFPDRVLPMLPENLSNNLCSLKPNEDRACLAVKMRIDGRGKLLDHKFVRGLMKSAARLTYRLAQEALDGEKTSYDKDLVKDVITPLYEAYKILRRAREQRGALDIERSEERIYLDSKGRIDKIAPRPHYTTHKIVEEMMILANVSAAIFLTDHQRLGVFRVHDQPDGDKVHALADFLKPLGLALAKSQAIRPKIFNKILEDAKKTPYHFAIQELVLRTQAQALYSPHNIGHYGLNLPRYMHFTSPIRRYADLIVHRTIISLLETKKSEPFPYDLKELETISEHISLTERRSSRAERETVERFISAYLSTKIGEIFECRIVGVTDFGIFVELLNNGAQGLIPFHLMPDDRYDYDRKHHRLIGRRHQHHVFNLGDCVKARLEHTEPISGSILLSVVQDKDLLQQKTRKGSKFKKLKPFERHRT